MRYTEALEVKALEMADDENTQEKVLEFFQMEFRTFGEALTDFVRKRMPADVNMTEEKYLQAQVKEKELPLNRTTIIGWFNSSVRPKMGAQSRENMFLTAFALNLSVPDVETLFKKVYLDRPFYLRDRKEFVYYYCFNNGLTYQRAGEILQQIEDDDFSCSDCSMFTTALQQDASCIHNDDDVVSYILYHPHNFSIRNKKAYVSLERLLDEIRVNDHDRKILNVYREQYERERKQEQETERKFQQKKSFTGTRMTISVSEFKEYVKKHNEDFKNVSDYEPEKIFSGDFKGKFDWEEEKEFEYSPKHSITINGKKKRPQDDCETYVGRELLSMDHNFWEKYKAFTSIDTMLSVILRDYMHGSEVKKTGKTIFINSQLPKEIQNNFPKKQIFSKNRDALSSDEIRKMLILLFSYRFWMVQQEKEPDKDTGTAYEDYKENLESLLSECGLQEPYYGNPFDWLFLYCAQCENPLNEFRNIVAEVEPEDEIK